MQQTAISSLSEYITTCMEEEHGHALGAEHPRLAGIFSEGYEEVRAMRRAARVRLEADGRGK